MKGRIYLHRLYRHGQLDVDIVVGQLILRACCQRGLWRGCSRRSVPCPGARGSVLRWAGRCNMSVKCPQRRVSRIQAGGTHVLSLACFKLSRKRRPFSVVVSGVSTSRTGSGCSHNHFVSKAHGDSRRNSCAGIVGGAGSVCGVRRAQNRRGGRGQWWWRGARHVVDPQPDVSRAALLTWAFCFPRFFHGTANTSRPRNSCTGTALTGVGFCRFTERVSFSPAAALEALRLAALSIFPGTRSRSSDKRATVFFSQNY